MALTQRRLNRATLDRQLLLERQPLSVLDAVERVVAIQAQEPASPYVALWNRVAGFDPTDLDSAFSEHDLVKASLMRITLHVVKASEYTTFHEAMLSTLRASRLFDRRFKESGLPIDEVDALVPHLLELTAEPKTKSEIESALGERLGSDHHERAWWALRTFAPLVHAPSSSLPWTFGMPLTYKAAPTTPERTDTSEAVAQLFRRYLEGFGPATAQDFAQFAMLRQGTIRPVLEDMADELIVYEGSSGPRLFDVPGAALPDEETTAPPRLMAMWDSVLLAYADRSRIIPEEYRKIVIRNNGDVLPTLLINGHVAGVWRHVESGIEARAFRPLAKDDWSVLDREAADLIGMLGDRDKAVYGRYRRWWEKASEIAGAEARILGT